MINLSFVLLLLVLMTVADTVIFCIKGSYPVEIYLALVSTCITEQVVSLAFPISLAADIRLSALLVWRPLTLIGMQVLI